MTQEYKEKQTTKSETAEIEELPETDLAERKANRDAEIDDLLGDIDSVLEANAQEFVQSYIQKGGE